MSWGGGRGWWRWGCRGGWSGRRSRLGCRLRGGRSRLGRGWGLVRGLVSGFFKGRRVKVVVNVSVCLIGVLAGTRGGDEGESAWHMGG